MNRTVNTTLVAALVAVCALAAPAWGALVWFDETAGGARYDSFSALNEAYEQFVQTPRSVITFDGFGEGTELTDQYADEFGVSFENTKNGKWSGVRREGGSIAEHITGYDGSYMPHGDNVYVKFDNDLLGSPFTMNFAEPVATVGAFVGMGVQGCVHTLTISAYDDTDALIGETTVESWLWESNSKKQNFESFFAVAADAPLISRVEILNDATKNYANALLIDNIAFDSAPRAAVPEPVSVVLMTGLGLLLLRRRSAVD